MRPLIISQKNLDEEISKKAAQTCDSIAAEMGAEIHDDLIQRLSVFQFYLDQLDRAINDPQEVARLLLGLRTDFERVKVAVRNISQRLMPVSCSDESLTTALESLCKNWPQNARGNRHFQAIGSEVNLSRLCFMYLYRIVQELIHNAFKHSTAWHTWVRLNWIPNGLKIEIEDDGTNSDETSETIAKLRVKVNTLRVRSKAIGAKLTFHRGKKGLLARVYYTKSNAKQ
jgi:signal transduction histidine kinase